MRISDWSSDVCSSDLGRDTKRHFNKTVRTPQFAPKILKRSAKVADRMMAHLAAAGVTHGDAIMLVDIGYNGTVQNMLEPLFAARMNLTVAGRYLLLREESRSEEHMSELQALMRISYAVFCWQKQNKHFK